MPFLVPATVSLAADVFILWLNRLAPLPTIYHVDEKRLVYYVGYLAPLAAIRIVLLLLPLLFHSYNGTALRYPTFYKGLYGGTLAVVVVHIMALCLLNPQSLEAMLPIESLPKISQHRLLLEHLHELRRIWWMLTLSVVSDVCHFILLWHVRSTAQVSTLLLNRWKQPSIYFALRSTGRGESLDDGIQATTPGENGHSLRNHPSSSESDLNSNEQALVNAMNEFVSDMQQRLQNTKVDWGTRLEDFTNRLASSHDRGTTLQQSLFPVSPFRILLQLFAYEEVLENGRLDAVFDMDDGAAITFFVPQLLTFLLHGALDNSPLLEEWILDKCRRRVQFAHRCYWFLRAWCLEVPVEAPAGPNLLADSHPHGSSIGLAPFLDEPAPSPQEMTCAGRRNTSSDRVQPNRMQRANDKLLPEERLMIERLMLRVKECGEEPARLLEYDAADADDVFLRVGGDMPAGSQENGQLDVWLRKATESGAVPVDPRSGFASFRHYQVLSAKLRNGFLALGQGDRPGNGASVSRGETDLFDRTPQFLDALIYMAESLYQFPREERKEEMRKQLRALECDLLPSNSVYLPIGTMNHRVWRIAADESICISTKERVPCIICMEVIEYTARKRRAKSWGFLDRLPRQASKRASSREGSRESNPSSEYHRIPSEVTDNVNQSEAEIVNEWRQRRRDPLRRISLLEKVTSTVRDNVKAPLDKVRDHLLPFRDRTISEELQSLTLAEALVDETSHELAEIPRRDAVPQLVDLENNNDESHSSSRESYAEVPSISRGSSNGSLTSMGQWSSEPPVVLDRPSRNGSHARGSLTGLRRRLDREAEESGLAPLPYGSDHDDEHKIDSVHERKGREARQEDASVKSQTRKPPVVFRESWSAKEERVRQSSAYGSHPGWRLLPVLIKGNDDLRQEQLASQLIYRMASILAREKVPVWLCPYEIIALTDRGGIIEAIPDTISLDSLKRNDPNYTNLRDFYHSHFVGEEELSDAKANFVESLAAYSIVCFLLQIKDRHNGNILIDNRGHIIHIDFGFYFLSSPGKNAGFENAPFKLTRDFVDVMDGPKSHLFRVFRDLCSRTFLALRKHCMEIILLVEMIKAGNEEMKCFRGRPDVAIRQLRDRFRLDLNDRACREYVTSLVDDSIENWRTDWYDRYQRYFVGVL